MALSFFIQQPYQKVRCWCNPAPGNRGSLGLFHRNLYQGREMPAKMKGWNDLLPCRRLASKMYEWAKNGHLRARASHGEIWTTSGLGTSFHRGQCDIAARRLANRPALPRRVAAQAYDSVNWTNVEFLA
jgi:hypothetical protein